MNVLHRARQGQQPFYGTDDFLFRVDEHADLERTAAEQLGIGRVFLGADAGQLRGLGSDGVGEEAGHDVGFVTVRHGQKDGRVFGPRIAEHGWAGTGPEDGLHVHMVLDPAELVGVLVDDHNLLLLLGQPLRDVEPHFPRSHDDDLEFLDFLGSTTKQHKASQNARRYGHCIPEANRTLPDCGSIA